MKSWISILFLFFLLVLPLTQAEIFITEEPENNYNVEDKVEISFEIKSDIDYRGPIQADLYCDEDFVENVFLSSVDFKENESQDFDFFFFVEETDECYVEIVFDEADEEEQTETFEVTDELDLEVSLNSLSFEPSEVLKINGSVEKELGENFDYSVLLNIEGILKDKRYSFSSEDFSIEYEFDSKIPAGLYDLELEVTEKNLEDDVINEASFSDVIEVLSKPTSLTISGPGKLTPPSEYSAKIDLLDQSGKNISGEEVYIRLEDPDGKFIKETTILSGENFEYSFSSSDLPREWTLRAIKGVFSTRKLITLEENKEVDLSLSTGENPVLTVTNVGNVLYDDVLDLEFNNENISQNRSVPLNISVGSSEDFKVRELVQEKGQNYTLSVAGKDLEELEFSSVMITGNVIGGNGVTASLFVVGFILVLLILWGLIYFIRKKSSKKEKVPKEKKAKKKIFKKKEKSSQKVSENSAPVVVNKVSEEKKKTLYGLFFKEKVSRELDDLLRKYGFSIHKLGEISLSMFKSSGRQEDKLVKLAKVVHAKTSNRNILIHSTDFEKNPKIIKSFTKIKGVFSSGEEGVFVTDNIHSNLSDKDEFERIAAFNDEGVWKLKI